MNSFVKAFKWLVPAVLLLPIGLYLLLAGINLFDSKPSELAIDYQAQIARIKDTTSEDAGNGYVFALGFTAPQIESPIALGEQRLKQLTEGDAAISTQEAVLPNVFNEINNCLNAPELQSACVDTLLANPDVTALFTDYQWLIGRYQQLINFDHWQDTAQFEYYHPLLPFTSLQAAQKLSFLKVLSHVDKLDPQHISSMLNQEMVFWQTVASDTYNLETKLIANGFMASNIKWGELVIARLGGTKQMKALPASWQSALPDAVFSFERVKVREWNYFRYLIKGNTPDDAKASLGSKLITWFLLPLTQQQDTANRYVELLNPAADLDSPAAAKCSDKFKDYIINPFGKLLLCASSPSMASFEQRFRETENQRANMVSKLQQNILSQNQLKTKVHY
ncbi:hypothetical protein L9G16_13975 [Shewanella sp. A25]|nr:hypothetical protein [Shewanella shenzhenensis]